MLKSPRSCGGKDSEIFWRTQQEEGANGAVSISNKNRSKSELSIVSPGINVKRHMLAEERLNKRLEELVDRSKGPWQTGRDQHAFVINVASFARSILGNSHPLVADLDGMLSAYAKHQGNIGIFIDKTIGILMGIKSDFEGGHLADLRSEIRAEVESDLLGQAQKLLEAGHKDSAAMLIGAVLEDALRQLCRKKNIPEGDSIEKMNAPLRNAGVYSLPQQQQITAWAAIRNKAAHAKFTEYSIEEVRLMLQGLTTFILNYLKA